MSRTIQSVGGGEPTIIISEPGWQQEAAAERQRQQDEEISRKVAEITAAASARAWAPQPTIQELRDGVAVLTAAWERRQAEKREEAEANAKLLEWADSPEMLAYQEQRRQEKLAEASRPRGVSHAEQLRRRAADREFAVKLAEQAQAGCGACQWCRAGAPEACVYRVR